MENMGKCGEGVEKYFFILGLNEKSHFLNNLVLVAILIKIIQGKCI